MKKLSIIIPVFNEDVFIEQTIQTVSKANTLTLKKEVIIIDDGSTDQTKNSLEKALTSFKKNSKTISFELISWEKNRGKGAAVREGILKSTGDIILIQDADLEYNPEDYPVLLEPFLKHGADVVYGSRFISNRPHRVLYFWHYQINVLLTRLSNMFTNLNLSDMETGYKVMRGNLVRQIAKDLKSKRFGFEPEITARLAKVKGIKFYEVGISYFGRTYQEGKKIGWRDGVRAIWEIIWFNLISS